MQQATVRKLRKEDWFHEDGFPIVVERRDPQEPFGLHSHEFCEIVVITGGKGLHFTTEDTYELSIGDAFVIGGDRPHDYLNMERLSLINILFEPEHLPMEFCDLPQLSGYHALFKLEPAFRKQHQFSSRLQLTPVELAHTTQLIDQLQAELAERGDGFRVMATTLFLQLVAYLSRCYSRARDPGGRSLLAIAAAISHLERNYSQQITLDELVEMSGMSRRNFLRIFESTMGLPPIKYLIRLRIRRACELLQQGELGISEIALRVGFPDSNYFSRQFRAVTGSSPSQYRGAMGNNGR
ncbi:helix-turn-helix domain-containing protein [Stieleria varia]|uniref:HTH-type transcriptional activator RhaR n=1 Tax=Stieleria varia TaxID=2528005 RepID=A0A5C6AFW6_9BACT|nr:helix-turn-helix domain-containing protein [Stieleria varia]TWT98340.1 HTH-type transcriptional activator RhaR [Stieleria varia]